MEISRRFPVGAAEAPAPLRLLERPRAPLSLPHPAPPPVGWGARLLRWLRPGA